LDRYSTAKGWIGNPFREKRRAKTIGLDVINIETSIASNYFIGFITGNMMNV